MTTNTVKGLLPANRQFLEIHPGVEPGFSMIGARVRERQRYAVTVFPNPGHDEDHPVADWPHVVFIRDNDNPLCSSWAFARSAGDAESLSAHLMAAIVAGS